MALTSTAPERFQGSRVLVTSADLYMGPAISERFRAEGAELIVDGGRYDVDPEEPAKVVAAAGRVDVLIVNLFPDFKRDLAQNVSEADWQRMFDQLVHPTMRFVKAVLPQMIERGSGKIVAVTSAANLRCTPATSAYTAARGAQNAYIQAVGLEVAPHNIQVNAVAQNFVYGGYPDNAMDQPAIRDMVLRAVPAGRIAEGWEQAELVLYLSSQASNFMCGQVFPFAGGWAT